MAGPSSCRLLINMRTCSPRPFSSELVWRLTTSAAAAATTGRDFSPDRTPLALLRHGPVGRKWREKKKKTCPSIVQF